jgi:hypothetical protein
MAVRSARRRVKNPKREVEWNGKHYKVKSNKIEIPDLAAMPRISALLWLNTNTYPRGHSKPNPLAGLGDAIQFTTR